MISKEDKDDVLLELGLGVVLGEDFVLWWPEFLVLFCQVLAGL